MYYIRFLSIIMISIASMSAVESLRLKDVIKSNGIGTINLFKDITAEQLEGYRLNCGGNLIFAVDVNEAANGSEKASTQGVTLKTVELQVKLSDGSDEVYHNFNTQTQALVAPEKSTTRSIYYTMLGETGSSRITGSGIRDSYDSTLEVDIQNDLSDVISAVLYIELLQTNGDLGDPEAFYDFSNGFEDIAILSSNDANFFNTENFGQDEAPVVIEVFPESVNTSTLLSVKSTIYYPSSNTHSTIAFEDLYPDRGDYDFNDLIVNYQVAVGLNSDGAVVKISGESYLIARGAGLDSNFRLRISIDNYVFQGNVLIKRTNPVSLDTVSRFEILTEIDLLLFESTKTIFTSNDGFAFTNTNLESSFKQGPKCEFTIYLDQPIPFSTLE